MTRAEILRRLQWPSTAEDSDLLDRIIALVNVAEERQRKECSKAALHAKIDHDS